MSPQPWQEELANLLRALTACIDEAREYIVAARKAEEAEAERQKLVATGRQRADYPRTTR